MKLLFLIKAIGGVYIKNIDLYRVFYITAIEKNFSKAANRLFITQPSVSHSIKQLENELAIQLFTRTSKGVLLTKEGEELFGYLKQAFDLIHRGEQKMTEMKNLQSGSVTVGGSDSTCKHYLLPYIQSFQELYPDIQIKLQHGSTPQILNKLTNGLIDIGIVHLPVNQSNVAITDFLDIHSTFVVGKKFQHLSKEKLSLSAIQEYPLISFSEASSSRKFLNQLFLKQQIDVKPDMEVGSVELLIECAKIGMGIAFVTKELVSTELAEKELFEVEIDEVIEKRMIGLAVKKDTSLSLAADMFLNHLLA
ncbi:LysR family transcriptional regulator [Oceanobacillus jeddahense]|uniref:LysR family transcriptional regulator n=1 Tax=Oceanobacillus jeddahense TaxID=1462527 RepID=A0ABY5JTB5_9BACI|nr:LysR family transcriptional regulator [Oceanobacillus jeddahense]UUI03587.1 LysR family transcriptional regulator [Oceanobacillus jeddahense]